MDRLPLLPGFIFNDPTENQFHVSHSLNYKNGYAIPRVPKLGVGQRPLDADSVAYQDLDQWCWDPSLTYGEPKIELRQSPEPKYAEFANKVLAFHGYCIEPKQNPLDEFPRVRDVYVYFHLEDDSLSIMEPPISNSGFVQGKVLRRHRIPKRSQENEEIFWHWKDLNVGIDIWLYGRTYHLASCDDFTREFLTSQGIDVGTDEAVPPDPYTELQRAKARRRAAAEQAIEAERSTDVTQRLDKLGRFLVFDRQVLRFFAVWRDPNDPLEETRHFRIHFYLADGTVEVRPEYKMNDGHYHYPTLVSRQLLPLHHHPVDMPSLSKTEYYTAEALKVGSTMNVLGRALILYDCDDFTRDYYQRRLGITQPSPLDVTPPSEVPRAVALPPHTGIGSAEDSLQSCLRLIPRAPNPSHCPKNEADRPLRYSLRIDSGRPSDQLRRFVLSFAPRVSHVIIAELPGRNTGVLSGRFLGPRRLLKPTPEGKMTPLHPQYYGPADFAIGAVVHASGQRFVVTGADLYVLRYLEKHQGLYPYEFIAEMRAYMQRQGLLEDSDNKQPNPSF